jgi:hypothetical protein
MPCSINDSGVMDIPIKIVKSIYYLQNGTASKRNRILLFVLHIPFCEAGMPRL